MRMHALAMGSAITGLTLTLLGSPVAQADDANFVRDTQALGFTQSSPNLVSTAQSACYFLTLRRDPGQITERIKRYLAVDPDKAHRFFVMSVYEYCPQYGAQTDA